MHAAFKRHSQCSGTAASSKRHLVVYHISEDQIHCAHHNFQSFIDMQDSQFKNITTNYTFWIVEDGFAAVEGLTGLNGAVYRANLDDRTFPDRDLEPMRDARLEAPASVPRLDAWPSKYPKPLRFDDYSDRWFSNVREVGHGCKYTIHYACMRR